MLVTKRTCSKHYYCCARVIFVRSDCKLSCGNGFKCALFASAQNFICTL